MSESPHISLPRTVFIITMLFSLAWIAGANMVMTTEIDLEGREVAAIENSVWIQQHRANQADSQPALPMRAVAMVER